MRETKDVLIGTRLVSRQRDCIFGQGKEEGAGCSQPPSRSSEAHSSFSIHPIVHWQGSIVLLFDYKIFNLGFLSKKKKKRNKKLLHLIATLGWAWNEKQEIGSSSYVVCPAVLRISYRTEEVGILKRWQQCVLCLYFVSVFFSPLPGGRPHHITLYVYFSTIEMFCQSTYPAHPQHDVVFEDISAVNWLCAAATVRYESFLFLFFCCCCYYCPHFFF